MKVFSLYHHNEFVASFKTREDAIFYGKQFYEDGWTCNILEEYLSKSPLVYTPPHYTSLHSLTPQQTIPCNPGVSLVPGTIHTNPHNDGVKAEPYKDVSAYWEKK